jgi:hypothetical protein
MSRRSMLAPGPFVASQLRPGDPYELSRGHAVLCLPTGARGSTKNLLGGAALETDPKVAAAGVDLGVSTEPGMLRAPDVAVGAIEDAPGWSKVAPPLAVEYADQGGDEEELQARIADLLRVGTRFVWVVRLGGPRRVEIHEPRKRVRVATSEDVLTAPGVLENPVPVAVLYDRDAAHEATLRNLLQRKGYAGLDAVKNEGREEGRLEGHAEGHAEGRAASLRESILAVLGARGLDARSIEGRVRAETDERVLQGALVRAATAERAEAVFAAPRAPKRPPRKRR